MRNGDTGERTSGGLGVVETVSAGVQPQANLPPGSEQREFKTQRQRVRFPIFSKSRSTRDVIEMDPVITVTEFVTEMLPHSLTLTLTLTITSIISI